LYHFIGHKFVAYFLPCISLHFLIRFFVALPSSPIQERISKRSYFGIFFFRFRLAHLTACGRKFFQGEVVDPVKYSILRRLTSPELWIKALNFSELKRINPYFGNYSSRKIGSI
jgi:hypothetical protein